MRCEPIRIVVLLATAWILSGRSRVNASDLPDTAVSSFRQGLAEDVRRLTNVRATISMRQETQERATHWVKIKKCGQWVVVHDTQPGGDDGTNRERVWGTNSRYTFHIGKNHGKWVLADLALEPNSKSVTLTSGIPLAEYSLALLLPHRYLFGVPIDEVFGGKLQSVSIAADPTRSDLRRVSFRIGKEDVGSVKADRVRSGYLTFDPGNGWRPVEATQVREKTANTFELREVYTYRTMKDSELMVERRLTTHFLKSAKPQSDFTFVDSYQIEPCEAIPESEFCLSSYGLPEPPGFEVKRAIPSYLWWLLAGTIAIAAALFGRRLLRRRRI